MTRLIGKLSKLSKYSASWSIVCTRLQTQAHVVIFLTLGELNKQQSQPTSEEAGGIALLRPRKRPKEGEALQEHRSACGYDERIVQRRRRGLRLRLANCCGRPLEMLEAAGCPAWSIECVRAIRTATETEANVRTPNPTSHAPRKSPAAKRQQGQFCPQTP